MSTDEPETTEFDHRPVMVDEITDLFAACRPGPSSMPRSAGVGTAPRCCATTRRSTCSASTRTPRRSRRPPRRCPSSGPGCARAIAGSTNSPTRSTTTASTRSAAHSSTSAFRRRSSTTPTAASRTGTTVPLDMRMDADQPWSAADVVNGYDEHELANIIRRYGDERFAGRIARAIVAARPLQSTTELAEVVTTAIPAAARRTGGHPAKRTFQAIRIEVNGELDVLPERARPGGGGHPHGRPHRGARVPLR